MLINRICFSRQICPIILSNVCGSSPVSTLGLESPTLLGVMALELHVVGVK